MNDQTEFGVVHIVAMNVPAFAFRVAHDIGRGTGRRERQRSCGQECGRSKVCQYFKCDRTSGCRLFWQCVPLVNLGSFNLAPLAGRGSSRSGQDDVDHLLFGIAQQLADALLAPDPGILEAAIGHAAIMLADAVDPDIAGLNGLGRLEIAPSLIAMARKSGSLPSAANGRPEITMIGMAGFIR